MVIQVSDACSKGSSERLEKAAAPDIALATVRREP
jgi:hypothetical protein